MDMESLCRSLLVLMFLCYVAGIAAGLFHTLNHAVFKALLFMGAGAILHSTHIRNMEEMGGLIRRMPATAFFFLGGSVAISTLPPLNGFITFLAQPRSRHVEQAREASLTP